jgi:hypothetical protein
MPTGGVWLAELLTTQAVPAADYQGDAKQAVWLPDERVAKQWMQYVTDTAVTDTTPPPAPSAPVVKGKDLTWTAEADLESGLAKFLIERDGKVIATVPEEGKNPFGRPIFQGLQYSDTPLAPLVEMRFTDPTAEAGKSHAYRIIAVNTSGLESK